MKRLFVIIFVVLAACSALAVATQPRQATGDGRVHLVWVTDDNPARRAQMQLFERLNPAIAISIDPSDNGLDKIIVQSQAGVGPDLFDCFGADQLQAYAKSGIAWNVSHALAARGIDTSSAVWPVAKSTCMVGDQVYGFPTNTSVYGLWLNDDVFAKSGVSPPPLINCTWGKILPIAERLTIRDPETGRVSQWGLLLDYMIWRQFVEQWGGSVYSSDGTRCTLDSPQAIRGMTFLHDLIYRYRIAPSPAEEDTMATTGGWGSGPISLFSAGRSAMAVGARYWLVTMRTVPELHLSAVECPHPAGGSRVYVGAARATVINAHSSHRAAALAFLQFLASKPYCDQIDTQADGVAAVKRYTDLAPVAANPAEDIRVWRSVVPYGSSNPVSPFIDADAAQDIMQKQVDLILADQRPVADALRRAAEQVNSQIAENVERDPQLRRQYETAAQAPKSHAIAGTRQ